MTENKQTKDPKSELLDWMGTRYPGEDFSDDSALFGQLLTTVGEYDAKCGECAAALEELDTYNRIASEEAARLKAERESITANRAASDKEIEAIRAAAEWTSDEIDRALGQLTDIADARSRGIIDSPTLTLLMRGSRYETDIEQARLEGEIRGRNAKIEEHLRELSSPGDGTPSLGGCNIGAPASLHPACLGALSRYGDSSPDIWERGRPR